MAGINLADQIRDPGGQLSGGPPPSSSSGLSLPSAFQFDFNAANKIRIVLSLIGILAIFGVKYMVKQYTEKLTHDKEAEIAQIQSSISAEKQKFNALKDIANEAESYNKRVEELQQKVNLVESLSKNRNFLVRMIDFTISEMPGAMWLQKVSVEPGSVDSKSPTPEAKADGKIELSGYTSSLQLVGEYVKRLEGAVFFPNWAVVETDNEAGSGVEETKDKKSNVFIIPRDTKHFVLNAKVVNP